MAIQSEGGIPCKSKKKGSLFSCLELRGKDLNLRPLGYEDRLVIARVDPRRTHSTRHNKIKSTDDVRRAQ